MGIILFLIGAASVLFHKREAREAIKWYYKFNYKLVKKEANETVVRIGYIIGGIIFMLVGLLMMANTHFYK